MHLAKFAPKLTLFPTNPSHAGGKPTRARTDLGSQNYRRSGKNHKQNQSQKRTPFAPARPESSEPETPETAKKSARLPGPPRPPAPLDLTDRQGYGRRRCGIKRPTGSTERRTARARRGLPDRVGAGSASASAPESLSPLPPPTPARGGRIEEEEERERGGVVAEMEREEGGTRRDAGERRKTR